MTTRRSLRTSVSPELYEEVERYARITGTTVARSAEYLLAFGAEGLRMWAERQARTEPEPVTSGNAVRATESAQNGPAGSRSTSRPAFVGGSAAGPARRGVWEAPVTVEVLPELAGPLWVTLRSAWSAGSRDGARLRPGARELLDALRLAAVQHSLAASGNGDHPTGQDGRGDTASAAPAGTLVGSAEAAKRLHCPARTIRWQAATGKIPGRKIGRDWLIWLHEEDAS